MYEKAILLFMLGIFGNFVGETVGCQLQKAFTNTIINKYFIIFLMIYFTLNFTSKEIYSPFIHLQRTMVIFIFYILINRMNYSFSILSLLLLVSLYIIKLQIEYMKSNKKYKKDTIKLLENVHNLLTYGLGLIIITGFTKYFLKQKSEHKDFSYITFLFGKRRCSSL